MVVANSRRCAWACFFIRFLFLNNCSFKTFLSFKIQKVPDLPLLLLMRRTLVIASFKMSVPSCRMCLLLCLTAEVDTRTKCRRKPGRIARSVFIISVQQLINKCIYTCEKRWSKFIIVV